MSAPAQEAFIALTGETGAARLTPLCDPVISPMHMAVENELWRVDAPGKDPRVLRLLHADGQAEFSANGIVEGAEAAGALGVGPEILRADTESGTLLMPFLDTGWRTATLFDLKDSRVRQGIIDATKRLHGGPDLSQVFDPFQRIQHLYHQAKQVAAPLPADVGWLIDGAEQVRIAVAATPVDLKPCRNDGCASNIMIHDDGRVVLIDYDLAGMNDPAFDLGVLLAEAEVFDDDAMAWVHIWHGAADDILLGRARLYGAVDDLGWAISAAINAHVSERISIEFRKYSEWRFMRCRGVIADRSFEQTLRRISGGQ